MKRYSYCLIFVSICAASLSAAPCSDAIGDFYINEINTKENWVEIYAKNPVPLSSGSLRACAIEKEGSSDIEVCETVAFSYGYDADGYFKILQFTIGFHDKVNDFVLYDSSGAIVDYFRVGMELDSYPLQIAKAEACGLDTACNIFEQSNNGQRNFARVPDGGCSWNESTWTNFTKDSSNTGGTLPPPSLSYAFDAWDTFRNIGDKKISTKISAQNFTLTLAALNEAATTLQEINATVCAQVVDAETGTAKSSWVSTLFTSQSTKSIVLNVTSAIKNARIAIAWKKDSVSGCPLTSADGETLSSDNFALRPERFDCESIPVSPLIAERSYPGTFRATPFNAALATPGYTTSSVVLSANKYMRTGESNNSLGGVILPSTLSFVEGSATAAVHFNDVGDIGIDLNDSTWAEVDLDDTPASERLIHAECRRTFRPHHFKVELTRPLLENNATDFTYLSNLTDDLNMSAWVRELNATITAQGEANTRMLNYADPKTTLYANDISLFPRLSLVNKHSSATKRDDPSDVNSSDLSGFVFVEGVARHRFDDVAFNYERSHMAPVSPFVVDGSETYFALKVHDTVYASVVGEDNTSSDANATFYYGRLRANDIATTLQTVSNPVLFEVYNSANNLYTEAMTQTSLLWYINNRHTGDIPGNIAETTASSSMNIDTHLGGFGFSYPSVSEGSEALGITSAINQKATIHLKTQAWLWYLPSALASSYSDEAGSDCTMHPCFRYVKTGANPVFMIKSGDFNGTTVPDENRGDYLKKGVKVFR